MRGLVNYYGDEEDNYAVVRRKEDVYKFQVSQTGVRTSWSSKGRRHSFRVQTERTGLHNPLEWGSSRGGRVVVMQGVKKNRRHKWIYIQKRSLLIIFQNWFQMKMILSLCPSMNHIHRHQTVTGVMVFTALAGLENKPTRKMGSFTWFWSSISYLCLWCALIMIVLHHQKSIVYVAYQVHLLMLKIIYNLSSKKSEYHV